jgi:hypothetical protein
MKSIIWFVLVLGLLFPFASGAQDTTLNDNLAISRNRGVKQLLDLRFRGGSGEFERMLISKVAYTPEARKNCLNNVVILSFSVDCNNNLSELKLRNAPYFGINEQLTVFYESIVDQWNTCVDERYTRFEIPVQFLIEGTKTSGRGFIVIEEKNPGYKCKSDQYYLENIEKHRKKGRLKKALEMTDILIKRDPYNQDYFELKKSLFDQNTESE